MDTDGTEGPHWLLWSTSGFHGVMERTAQYAALFFLSFWQKSVMEALNGTSDTGVDLDFFISLRPHNVRL